MKKKVLIIVILMLALFIGITLALQTTAAASQSSPASVPDVIDFKNVFIPQATVVDHVVVIGGNVTIGGTITDEVVVINGNLTLLSTAQLEKRVFVLGGHLNKEDGAIIKKGVINLEASSSNTASILSAALLLLLFGFVQLAVTFALLLILPALSYGFRVQCQQLARVCQLAGGKAAALGFLSGLAFVLLESLLVVSVVGIPLAFLVGIFFLLTAIFGASSVCQAIGEWLAAKTGEFDRPIWQQTLYGAAFVSLAANIPFLGPLFLGFILLLGVGVVGFSFFQDLNDFL